jgi:hypothetical protein
MSNNLNHSSKRKNATRQERSLDQLPQLEFQAVQRRIQKRESQLIFKDLEENLIIAKVEIEDLPRSQRKSSKMCVLHRFFKSMHSF